MVEAVAFLVEVAFPPVEVAFQAVTRQRLVVAVVAVSVAVRRRCRMYGGGESGSMVVPVEVAVAPPLTANYDMHLLAVQQQFSLFCLLVLILAAGHLQKKPHQRLRP